MNANNKNTSVPENSFSKVRSCSYDPTKDLIVVKYDDSDKQAFYLQVPHRLIWFQCYCEENQIQGMVDDAEVTYIPELKLVQAVCTVYMNGAVAGRSAAGCAVKDNDFESINNAVQTAATRAKGRALANAGFGTPAGQGNLAENGDLYPCDAGMPYQPYPQMTVSGGQVTQPPQYMYGQPYDTGAGMNPPVTPTPGMAQGNQGFPFPQVPQSQSAGPVPQPAAGYARQPMPVQAMTLEQARNYVVPSGKQAGKKLCELDNSTIQFYATQSKNQRYPEFIQAAKVVWNDIAQRLGSMS